MNRFTATGAALLLATATAWADDDARRPLVEGFYAAPMATYLTPDSDRDLDNGSGATLGLGYRFGGSLALELAGFAVELDPESGVGSAAELSGFNLSLLIMPTGPGHGFYGLIGAGYQEAKDQPNTNGTIGGEIFDLGFGYIYPLSFGDYEFAVRAEVRGRAGDNDDVSNPNYDNGFMDALANVGLHLPLGKRYTPPPPPPPAVEVVQVKPVCSDGKDNDGDGAIDYPDDPGCTDAQDANEANPQCSDGRDNDDDGLIDGDDPGCDDDRDDDETDPCREPAPGEPVDLSGCRAGDVMVLRGVNFEFDKAGLTAEARRILDSVSDSLEAYPQIEVEVGGHTDAKGSDSYNQRLSQQRAQSVLDYLASNGIAPRRLTAVGYGEDQPVDTNDTDAGRANNRRVELKITAGTAR